MARPTQPFQRIFSGALRLRKSLKGDTLYG